MCCARDNDAWAILACITYISNDFEFDVLRIGVPWAGFGFLFLVAHGKVRALVQTHGEIGPGRSRWTIAAGSAPAVATAARCDRGVRRCYRSCLPDCRTSLSIKLQQTSSPRARNANQTQSHNMAPRFCQFHSLLVSCAGNERP